jgi:hypothetical protein
MPAKWSNPAAGRGFFWKIEKQGYEPVMAVAPTFQTDRNRKHSLAPRNFQRVLDPVGKLPPGMVRAEIAAAKLPGYYIDKYEVTNKDFKTFIEDGGYQKPEYWKNRFLKRFISFFYSVAMFCIGYYNFLSVGFIFFCIIY